MTPSDFDLHDSKLLGIQFLDEGESLQLNIDYVSQVNKLGKMLTYSRALANVLFGDVYKLKINIDLGAQ